MTVQIKTLVLDWGVSGHVPIDLCACVCMCVCHLLHQHLMGSWSFRITGVYCLTSLFLPL